MLAFALIYYFAPDFREQSWQWLTPGAAIGVVLWILAYVTTRNNPDTTVDRDLTTLEE